MKLTSTDKVVSEEIADRLREDIISGQFPEGTPLREIALAERFNVGRAPVREALQRLSYEALLVSKPNCGVQVAPAPPDQIQELIVPLRRTLEVFALKSFFHDLDQSDFEKWEHILVRMKAACEAKDYLATAKIDIEFHRSIIERAEQTDLLSMWISMISRLRQHFQEGHQNYDDTMKIYHEHVAVVSMFRTGNLEQSIKALEWNIE